MRYSVLVLSPSGDSAQAELMLSKFDEALEVPAYAEPCYCVGSSARHRAYDLANAKMPIEQHRKEFSNLPEVKQAILASKQAGNYGFSPAMDEKWRSEFELPFEALREQFYQEQPDKDAPDPECTSCQGKGYQETTYNPNTKFDQYVLGGIWEQHFDHLQGRTAREFLSQPEQTFAILTPEGEWLQKSEIILQTTKPNDNWQQTFTDTLQKFADCHVLVYDCHI